MPQMDLFDEPEGKPQEPDWDVTNIQPVEVVLLPWGGRILRPVHPDATATKGLLQALVRTVRAGRLGRR